MKAVEPVLWVLIQVTVPLLLRSRLAMGPRSRLNGMMLRPELGPAQLHVPSPMLDDQWLVTMGPRRGLPGLRLALRLTCHAVLNPVVLCPRSMMRLLRQPRRRMLHPLTIIIAHHLR